ncbi:hypothetical protein [Methylobacterium fujisawaense]|uniref:hypothetical protein n=1 Tax=Methylobacterium fujisawaense TaxID=107400 RepID=UPI003702FF72
MAALYGLVLQAFLATLLPVATRAREAGVICAAQDGGGVPSDHGTSCPEHLCCLAVHLGQPLAAPVPVSASLATLWRLVIVQVWRPVEVRSARGPPDRAVSSRGPPAA